MRDTDRRKTWSIQNPQRLEGLLCILVAALIWVLASFVVQQVEDDGVNPFLLSYIANSLFIVYLPLDNLIKQAYRSRKGSNRNNAWSRLTQDSDSPELTQVAESSEDGAFSDSKQQLVFGCFEAEVFKAACVVAPLWFLAQLTFNVSLHLTSVTSNTILSSTSSLFTYGLSMAVLGEQFIAHKLVSIIACAAGTAVVTLADSSNSKGRPSGAAGDALCLLSAGFYACYTISIKKMLPSEKEANMMLFFGYIGLINLLGLAPILLGLSLFSVVSVSHLTPKLLGLVICKGLLDNVVSDFLWARAVLLIGPTVATVGMSVQVPLAVALDVVWKRPAYIHSTRTLALMVLGGWYVLAGFLGINLAPRPKNELSPHHPASPPPPPSQP